MTATAKTPEELIKTYAMQKEKQAKNDKALSEMRQEMFELEGQYTALVNKKMVLDARDRVFSKRMERLEEQYIAFPIKGCTHSDCGCMCKEKRDAGKPDRPTWSLSNI